MGVINEPDRVGQARGEIVHISDQPIAVKSVIINIQSAGCIFLRLVPTQEEQNDNTEVSTEK